MILGRDEAGPLGWNVWESEARGREGLGPVTRGQELAFTLSRAGTTTDRFLSWKQGDLLCVLKG